MSRPIDIRIEIDKIHISTLGTLWDSAYRHMETAAGKSDLGKRLPPQELTRIKYKAQMRVDRYFVELEAALNYRIESGLIFITGPEQPRITTQKKKRLPPPRKKDAA